MPVALRRISVFTGSSRGRLPEYAEAAAKLAAAFLARRIGLVYGGAHVGLMGVVADAMLAGDGEVIGVIPEALVAKEVAHTGLSNLRIVTSMHERKALMSDLSDGFIAMPGGIGTFEEFFEVLTWAQLGLHRKPCGLLNVAGYYDGILACVDHATREGFLRAEHRGMILVSDDADDLLDRMAAWQPPVVAKWIERAER